MANETEIERLVVRLIGDGSSYMNMLNTAQNSARTFATAVAGYGAIIGGLVGVGSLAAAGTGAVKLAADLETTSIAFEVMLGSATKAKNMLEEIRVYAAKTPFEQAPLRQSAQMLMNYGIAAEQVMPTLKMLGEVSAGDQNKLNGLAYAFAQMSAKGHVAGDDLRQMINWGFNPIQEMSRTSGKSMSVLMDQVHKGTITIPMLNEAFRTASSEGGRFFGMMDKQSKTLGGLFSTLKDDVSNALVQIGQVLIKELNLKDIVAGASNWIGKYTDTVVNGLNYGFAVTKNIGSAMFGWLKTQWNGLVAVVQTVWDQIVGITTSVLQWTGQLERVTSTFQTIMQNASTFWTYLKQGFISTAGFIANFSENVSILWKWMGDNWFNLWKDMWNIIPVFLSNMLSNFVTTLNTNFRLWVVFEGWIVGLFKRLFSFEVVDAVLTGLIVIGEKIREWAAAAWETIKAIFTGKKPTEALNNFINQTKKDFVSGMENLNLFEEFGKVLQEGAADIKNPLEGFKSSITDLPKLNLEMGNVFDVPKLLDDSSSKAMDTATSMGIQLGSTIGKGIKAAEPFDAAISGSKEYFARLEEQKVKISGRASVNANPQKQTTNAVKEVKVAIDNLAATIKTWINEPPIKLNQANLGTP